MQWKCTPRCLLVFLLFLIACGGPSVEPVEEIQLSPDPESVPEDVTAIVGRVLDFETGEPLASAVISTSPASEVVLTNSRGEFVLQRDILIGEYYRVEARADGYSHGHVTALALPRRRQVDLALVSQDRQMPVLFFPETPVFGPATNRVDVSMRSRVDEDIAWNVHHAPDWLEVTAPQGVMGSHDMVWLALTLSPDEFAVAAEDEEILYGTVQFRDGRNRIALLHVAAVPAAPGLINLEVTLDSQELLVGQQTTARVRVTYGQTAMAGAAVAIEIDGPEAGLVPAAPLVSTGGDGRFSLRLSAGLPGDYELTFRLPAYQDVLTITVPLTVDALDNPCAVDNGGCPDFTQCVFDGINSFSCQNIDLCEVDGEGNNFCGVAEHWECIDRFGAEPHCIDIDHCSAGNHPCDLEVSVCVNQIGGPPLCEPLTTVPAATVEDLAGPQGLTNQTTAQLSFTCSEANCTYGCELHGQSQGLISGPASCDSPAVYTDLADDDYLFVVYVTDAGGGEGEARTWSWRVDTVAPTIVGLDGPASVGNQPSAHLSYGCSKTSCTFECRLETQLYGTVVAEGPCASSVTYPFLLDDVYTFSVRAVDAAGNTGPWSSRQWTVDTVPPVVTVLDGPPPFTTATTATFDFACSEAGCQFLCHLVGATQAPLVENAPCASGESFSGLADDEYVFSVAAVDAAGNVGPAASWTWTVDNSLPDIAILDAPTAISLDDWAYFEFECTNKPACAFECALDYDPARTGTWQSGLWQPCSSPHWLDELSSGDHRLRIRATDDLGMDATVEYLWTVEIPGWIAISSGSSHSCGITTDHALHCWGAGNNGRLGLGDTDARLLPTQVGSDHNWQTISAGAAHSCAIRLDGTLWCWGEGASGKLGLGTTSTHYTPQQVGTESDWIAVSTGNAHTCAIRSDHSLWCWGNGLSGRLGLGTTTTHNTPQQVEPQHQWLQVSANSSAHTCAIRADQTLWCWGVGSHGQLGQGTQGGSSLPLQVLVSPGGIGLDDDVEWVSVTTGQFHTCAVRFDGSLWCFGRGSEGQLGTGSTSTYVLSPQLILFDYEFTWTEVVAGHSHTCATREDESLWCWGQNEYGQIGQDSDGLVSTVPTMVDAAPAWRETSGGGDHTCAIDTDDMLHCWGYNYNGQLGLGLNGGDLYFPTALAPAQTSLQIAAGQDHGCSIAPDQTLRCWGRNNFGKLGLGDRDRRAEPVQIGAATDWQQLSLAQGNSTFPGGHTCGIRDDGTLWCWGRGDWGRLGLGDTNDRVTPEQVGVDTNWDSVAAGHEHSCAIRDDGTLWCWGRNFSGQLGIGSTTNQSAPTQVGTEQWLQVSTAAHTCAIRADRTLWCWGAGGAGRLGLGDTSNRNSPEQVGSRDDWQYVSTGYAHTCAIDATSTLWCWGQGSFGRLGLGDTSNRLQPEALSNGWSKVSGGYEHSCAIRTTGQLYCWGRGTSGRLGNGATTNHHSPQLLPFADWVDISAGHSFSLGIRASGEALSWGSNQDGELGNGRALKRVPIFVDVP